MMVGMDGNDIACVILCLAVMRCLKANKHAIKQVQLEGFVTPDRARFQRSGHVAFLCCATRIGFCKFN